MLDDFTAICKFFRYWREEEQTCMEWLDERATNTSGRRGSI
jgi:hypothetical protein